MPAILASVVAIYGLVVSVIITNQLKEKSALHTCFLQLGAGLCVGLSGLAAGYVWPYFTFSNLDSKPSIPHQKPIHNEKPLANVCPVLSRYSFSIGIIGDAGVRGSVQQPKLYIGMMLIIIFAEVLGEFLPPSLSACIPPFSMVPLCPKSSTSPTLGVVDGDEETQRFEVFGVCQK